jgi:hypothetical protein
MLANVRHGDYSLIWIASGFPVIRLEYAIRRPEGRQTLRDYRRATVMRWRVVSAPANCTILHDFQIWKGAFFPSGSVQLADRS